MVADHYYPERKRKVIFNLTTVSSKSLFSKSNP